MRAATFTTYINAQTDPGLEQAFQRQAQIATSSYATIERAAEQATRATAGLLGGRGTAGASAGTQAIQQRTQAIRSTVAAAADAERATTKLATATRRQANEAAAAQRQNAGLARGLATTSVALNVVSGRLDPVASRLNTLTRAVTDLTGVQLGLAAFGATLFALGRTANTYANLEARIRPFYDSQKQVNAAMNDVIGIAQRSRSALEPVVDVYTRLTTVGQNIGLSRSSISQVTEIATKAANIGGGTAQARDAALLQFGQALSGDFKAAGQEINSLKEQAPVLFQAILKGYKDNDGAIGVSLARFKKLAEAGELSTAKVLDAVRRSSGYIDQMAARVPNTLSRAGTDFSNALTTQIGRLDQSLGFTSTLADGLSLIAQNLRVIISLAAGVGTTFAAIKISGLVAEGAQAVASFRAQQAAATALATRRQAAATASLEAHRREIAAREIDQAEIRKTIALLEAERVAAVQANNAYRNTNGTFRPVTPVQNRDISQNLARERNAIAGLSEAGGRLRLVNDALAASKLRAAAASDSLARATKFTSERVGLLRSVGGGLVSFLGGPWGIAFGVATTAIYLLATAETAAEKATRLHEDAQRSFANIIDRSTGKIYDQVDALQKLDIARKLKTDVNTSFQQAVSGRNQIVDVLQNYYNRVDQRKAFALKPQFALPNGDLTEQGRERLIAASRTGPRNAAEQQLQNLVQAFQRGDRGSYNALAEGVTRLAPKIDGLTAALPQLARLGGTPERNGQEGTGFLGAYSRLRQGRAARRILAGQGQAGDAALALGEEPQTVTTPTAPKKRTRAQIEAAAASEAASTDVERARAALKELRAQVDPKTGLLPGRDDVQTQHELAAAITNVTTATKAQADARRSASAGRAQERKEARDATQDALDDAGRRRDAALLKLSQGGANPSSNEFLQARIAILKTYDDEVNKIDASRAASSTAAAQQIADAKRIAAAAQAAGEKRSDILAGYDDAPKAIDRARDQIQDLRALIGTAVDGVAFIGKTREQIEEIKKANPLGTGIYTKEIADADAARIEFGIRKPLRDLEKEYARGLEIANLQLQGRDAEAAALQRRNQLLDGGIELSDGEYESLVRNERQQLRINDALASRQRVVSTITGALDSARDTAEGLFTSLQTGGNVGNVFKQAYNDFRQQFAKIQSRQLVERLFAGSDEKLRALLEGRSSVDTAIGRFGSSIDVLSSTSGRGVGALDRFTTAAEKAAARLDAVAPGEGVGVSTDSNLGVAANDNSGGGEILVVGSKLKQVSLGNPSLGLTPVDPLAVLNQGQQGTPKYAVPSARQTYNSIGSSLFGPLAQGLDSLVDKVKGTKTVKAADGTTVGGSSFFKGIGNAFGTALEGAGKGAIASGFAKALGIKQSGTGAQIGGAIGALSGIPGGAIIGGLLGGTIGGLFKKTKTGASTISLDSTGQLVAGAGFGNSGAASKAATGTAKSVVDGLNSVAQALGAKITGSPNITIGTRDGNYRVNTGGTDLRLKKGAIEFGKEGQQEAIEYAIRYSIEHAVITGISQASVNILKSGQDLQAAIAKATAIESIPKRLLQLTNPVKYAVTTLNDEFEKLISYLKEGGASADQFADAQKLYDLERASAIKQATEATVSALDQFLKDMVGGSASPLNKRTTYQNAANDLAAFKADIAGGKAVDQDSLLSAARNFQDASRALNGSSQSFFDDFDMLRSLLQKARDNAGITDVTTLPASPFASDSSVQAAIASLQNAGAVDMQRQTDALSAKLDDVIGAIEGLGLSASGFSGYDGTSIGLLPGFKTGYA